MNRWPAFLRNKWVSRVTAGFEVFAALIFIIGGVQTGIQEAVSSGNFVATFFGSHLSLLIFGLAFFIIGTILMYCVFRKKAKRLHGWALMSAYCLALFALLINLIATGMIESGITTGVLVIILGLIYLRHRVLN